MEFNPQMESHVNSQRVSPNEVILDCELPEAFSLVSRSLMSLGKVKKADRTSQYFDARVKHGLQSVKVRVSLVERDAGKTNVVIQSSSDDVWGAGAKSATNRFIETLDNINNPGYRPDRLGVHPGALVGYLAIFVVLLILLMKLLG